MIENLVTWVVKRSLREALCSGCIQSSSPQTGIKLAKRSQALRLARGAREASGMGSAGGEVDGMYGLYFVLFPLSEVIEAGVIGEA